MNSVGNPYRHMWFRVSEGVVGGIKESPYPSYLPVSGIYKLYKDRNDAIFSWVIKLYAREHHCYYLLCIFVIRRQLISRLIYKI